MNSFLAEMYLLEDGKSRGHHLENSKLHSIIWPGKVCEHPQYTWGRGGDWWLKDFMSKGIFADVFVAFGQRFI